VLSLATSGSRVTFPSLPPRARFSANRPRTEETLWIITAWHRSAMTVLVPEAGV
jgi:hypothetical protein